ncbi:hypothetical protein AX14_007174 [Amanita brunnescens Koide BX004]|nr:hypothetical protein AX14_007174 [Amanita brunnescens Koide BX004]
MKYAYPAAVAELSNDPPLALALRIARHSPCDACPCRRLQPPHDAHIFLDASQPVQTHSLDHLGQYGSDDDEISPDYLDVCECGHSVPQHGADETTVGRLEFLRRGRVATRLDEQLQDVGKLLDFEYADDDITSLRKQLEMRVSSVSPHLSTYPLIDQASLNPPLSPISSELSDLPSRPTKKQRLSSSSLSDAEDQPGDDEDAPNDEDDEEYSFIHPDPQRPTRAGKKSAPGLSLAPTPLIARTPHIARVPAMDGKTSKKVNGAVSGQHDARVKVEDQMDEGQLKRLATGVPIDSAANGVTASGPLGKPEKAAAIELRKGVIKITAVENDKEPRSLVILTGLKTLFQKQLPKMPREYIARLVYDSNSKALAIIKRGYKVVGGICYRPFPHRGFAEIVFFATNSADQEKGYGGMLMDHFKAHIRKTYPSMMHFLTYADNYAVGYFEKQGFSKDITLDRSVWAGYIKDYEGGTIMQCTLLNKVDYLDKPKILASQQQAVMTKIRTLSRSHIIHPGLTSWRIRHDGGVELMDPKDVPGLSMIHN